MKTYNTIACGGTFDLLHSGHEYFLDQILDISQNVILGLTSDAYVSQNKADRGIAPFQGRKNAIEEYLKGKNALESVKIIAIDDIYGPLLDKNLDIDALAVTDESKKTADVINKKRTELGLFPLHVEVVSQLRDSQNQVISATRVRRGEIDRKGKNLLLPVPLRHALQTAWGEILEEVPQIDDSSVIVTVGDVTTRKFIEQGIIPFLCVIDNIVERKAVESPIVFQNTQRIFHIDNPAGTINKKIFSVLDEIFSSNTNAVIEVKGEEDLLVLPVLLQAPLGTHVYYGQPHVGLVRVIITEDVKNKSEELIEQFDIEMPV